MKKTFRFLSMAALLVVGAIMTGCSSDDNIDNPQQPANKDNVVTLTATVGFEANATTRAVTEAGVKTFESTNKIAVFYEDGDGKIQKAESGALTLSNSDKTATFTVTLSNPKSGGNVRYVYPATMAKALDATPPAYPAAAIDDATIDYSGLFSSQNGDLTTLGTNYDLAVFDGSLSGTDLPASATLTNPLAICKFALTDGSSPITSSVNSLTVSDGTNAYAVAPSSLSAIYVAMKPASGKIAFTAATGSKTYFKTTASAQTLTASTLYTKITVSMVELAVGNVIGYDGKIYASKSAAGSNAAAVIVYLGSDNGEAAPYNHGLALAMSDAGGSSYFQWSTSSTKIHTYNPTSESFASESGLQYNATHNTGEYPAFQAAIANNSTAAPTSCSAWFLASGYQWTKMFAGDAGGLKTLASLQSGFYWSSTEVSARDAWNFYSDDGVWYFGGKDDFALVRSCLAF
jgi:hypothetical protein